MWDGSQQHNGTELSDRTGTPDTRDFDGNGTNDLGPIQGSASAEIIHGKQGDDDIFGHGGGDRLSGDEGDDWIIAGSDSANAYLDGGVGRDILVGSNGRDHLIGGPNDTTDTDDALQGGPGDDYIEGGGGNDVLFGGPGSDLILGGEGDDHLRGASTGAPLDRTWTATPVATILAGSAGDDGLYGDDDDILQKQAA